MQRVGRGQQLVDHLAHVAGAGGSGVLHRLGERRVLLAVGDRVQAEHRRLLGRVEVPEANVQPVRSRVPGALTAMPPAAAA